MKQNETLKQMLADFHPDLGNGDTYMQQLEQKLDTIDSVKQMYATERRRNRSHLVVAFISGGLAGVLLTIYFFLHPLTVFSANAGTYLQLLADLIPLANLFLNIILAVALSVGIAMASTQCYGIMKKELTW